MFSRGFPLFFSILFPSSPQVTPRQDDHGPCHGAHGLAAGDDRRRGCALSAAAGRTLAATRALAVAGDPKVGRSVDHPELGYTMI